MGLDGICAGGYDVDASTNIINCCSAGDLSVLNGTSDQNVGVVVKGGGNHPVHITSYYLSEIQGIFTLNKKSGDTIFYKTSDDPDAMTTIKVVDAMNSYIQNPDEGVDTIGWCQWIVGDNNLPELDFDTEWNGTDWVTVNN